MLKTINFYIGDRNSKLKSCTYIYQGRNELSSIYLFLSIIRNYTAFLNTPPLFANMKTNYSFSLNFQKQEVYQEAIPSVSQNTHSEK